MTSEKEKYEEDTNRRRTRDAVTAQKQSMHTASTLPEKKISLSSSGLVNFFKAFGRKSTTRRKNVS
jgi:hypothetical protein